MRSAGHKSTRDDISVLLQIGGHPMEGGGSLHDLHEYVSPAVLSCAPSPMNLECIAVDSSLCRKFPRSRKTSPCRMSSQVGIVLPLIHRLSLVTSQFFN
jgi:hypothetical protein